MPRRCPRSLRLRAACALTSLLAAAVLLAPRPAAAIVNQVDGTIVPVTTRLQQCLDKSSTASTTNPAPGEGPTVLDAVRDAGTFPQTFTPTPRMSDGRRVVTFTMIGEGAGFRDRFGWYNVGDSPYTAAARNEVYGCRDAYIATGCSCPCPLGPRMVVPTAAACTRWINPNIVEVDFDCLRTAGRWRGGPVAFYILTPEPVRDVPCTSSTECTALGPGSYCSTGLGRCMLGGGCAPVDTSSSRVYSTDNAVNDDGDYVHFLTYTSRTFANAFYFGFEDLFRGGDNDFEDVLVRAVGLVPFCNPTPEVCDGRDNNCNGLIDDGVGPGGSCGHPVGECRAGMLVCVMGRYVCQGLTTGTPEVCDGLDNNCNGTVDEGNPGGGAACNAAPDGAPLCTPGMLVCRGGRLACEGGTRAGVEVCDCEDNDCDRMVDEDPAGGTLCAGGGRCIACACRTPCLPGEFPCSLGLVCNSEGFCVPPLCGTVTCRDTEACREGRCVDACAGQTCAAGQVCRATAGIARCVENNCYGLGCETPGQVCLDSACVDNPCNNVSCGAGEFCRRGACVASCADVPCGRHQSCRDGACVDDPCAGVSCPAGRVCRDGACVGDVCANTACSGARVCRAGDDGMPHCVDDPCAYVTCPGADTGVVCRDGQCVRPGQGFFERDRIVALGGGGAACAVARPVGSAGHGAWRAAALALVAALALALGRGRGRGRGRDRNAPPRAPRRAHTALFVLALFVALVVGPACAAEPYCLNCVDGGGGESDVVDRDVTPVQVGCTPTGPEVCDLRDNDCDGEIDEGFDTQTDPRNCGACGTACDTPHAVPQCLSGRCAVRRCDVGYYDLDHDPSNGCEYRCNPTATMEVCDGMDNNCDGTVDEGFDLRTDVNNCGACRNACRFTQGTARCDMGRCVLVMCNDGFVDLDRNPANGCEYACARTGSEVCDGRDNDCNGTIDEGCLRLFPASEVRLDQGVGANSVRPVINGDGAMTLGVAYMDLRNGEADIYFARSVNNGTSFAPDVRLDRDAPGTHDSVAPALAWSGSRAVAAWSDFRTSPGYREVWTAGSSDDGASFPTDARANSGTGDAFNIRVAASGSAVVAVWEELLADRSRQIRYARSATGAGGWTSGRVDHAATAGTVASEPALAMGGPNEFYVVWHDNRNGLTDVFFNRSIDGGASWLPGDVRMDTDAPGSHGSQSATVAADTDGRVYVAWQDVRTGRSFDIYARTSSDRGATFTATDRRLDTTTFDQDSLAPRAVSLGAGKAVVVWQDFRWGRANLYASTTSTGGMSWSSADVQVMGGRGRSTATDFAVAATGNTVFVVWSDDRDGRTDVYANYSNDAGDTFQPDDVRLDTATMPGSSDSETPTAYAAGGVGHFAWVDRRADGVVGDIYYRSLRP